MAIAKLGASTRSSVAVLAVLLACMTAGGCADAGGQPRADADPTPTAGSAIDRAAVDAVTEKISEDLNGPAIAISNALQQAVAGGGQVYANGFELPAEDGTQSFEWWFLKRDLIRLDSFDDYGGPVMRLTGAGALAAAAQGPWLNPTPGQPQNVNCAAGESISVARCNFDITYSPVVSAAGATGLGAVKVEPFTIHADLQRNAEGWQIINLSTEGPTPRVLVLQALFGPAESREQTRQAEIQAQLGRLIKDQGAATAHTGTEQ